MAQPDLIERDYYTVTGGKIASLPVREVPETCWGELLPERIKRFGQKFKGGQDNA